MIHEASRSYIRASWLKAVFDSIVSINIEIRSAITCKNGIKHSAYPGLDNCYRDYAQQNAQDLADVLRAQGAAVAPPPSPERDNPKA